MKALALLITIPSLASAVSVDDLWITEVVPSTGQVEITNVGDGPLTTSSRLPFCHRFRYTDDIPSGTTFEQGESKVFTANFSNAGDSDLWLYRVGGAFGNASNIITGLKWGPAGNVGRTGIATTAGKWDGVGLPVPAAGMALHLIVADPTKSTSWSIGPANLGQFGVPLEPLVIALDESEIQLSWQGGIPPFRVETSQGLGNWETLTGLLVDRTHTVMRMPTEPRRYFRVRDLAMQDESAEYRITYTSLWSEKFFASVPGGDHFSGLVGGMHDGSVSFWMPGALASTGIKNMAETGSKTALLSEVQAAITGGGAEQSLSGSGLGGAPSQTTLDFTATRSHPLLTITSMIAPSPDWFVGVQAQSLLMANDDWVDSLSFDLVAYDAGTDNGSTFTSPNQITNPADPVFMIPASHPSFAPASGPVGDPVPIARLVIERVD